MFVFQCLRHEQDCHGLLWFACVALMHMSLDIGNWSASTWLPAIGDNLPYENPFLTNQ